MHKAKGQHAQSDEGGEQLARAKRELISQHVAEREVLADEQTVDADAGEQRTNQEPIVVVCIGQTYE